MSGSDRFERLRVDLAVAFERFHQGAALAFERAWFANHFNDLIAVRATENHGRPPIVGIDGKHATQTALSCQRKMRSSTCFYSCSGEGFAMAAIRGAEAATVPVAIVWGLAGPITYILAVVHTWHSKMAVIGKIAVNLTLDAILAVVWPVTWLIWTVRHLGGADTPLRLLLG